MIGIGSSVGHYVVRAKLGEGAMGTVYLGQHHVLDARVAIKVIRRDAERTEEDVSRFFTEARSASRIGHENIVGVLDFGKTGDGDPYYIMELLEGESLAGRLARGRRELPEVLHVATQIADALAASHGKGIVHRDLKPGNVFLVRRAGNAQFVKLLDFGVAKLVEEGDEEQRGHRTNTGRLLGTPHYMAPEQVAGRRAIDGRADVYALGVLLFEMLCGRLPFDAPKWTEVLIQHVTQAPPRVRELVPECPAWLERLVDLALAKSAHERPSMAAMRDALRAQDDALLVSPQYAPTLASETVASVDSHADRARATRTRARRSAAFVALALGAGGTALGAVFVVSTHRGAEEPVVLALDGGVYTQPSWFGKADKLRGDRYALLDAGLAVPEGSPSPAPPALPRPAAPPPRPDAAPPLPQWLDGYDIYHALAATLVPVAACNDRYESLDSLDVTLDVGHDGSVLDVRFGNDMVGTFFALCVERAIKSESTFPPFQQSIQEIPYRYDFAPLPPGTSGEPPRLRPAGSAGSRAWRTSRSTRPPRP